MLLAHTKTCEQLVQNLLFADDAALVAHTEKALQHLTSCFAETAQLFGFKGQPEKDGSSPPTCTSRIVSPFTYHQWRDWVEDCPPVHLLGLQNHIRCQDLQKNRQQTGQFKQRFWQIVQKSLEKQASEEGHQNQRVQSRHTHHPTVGLWSMGNLSSLHATSWAFAPALSPHYSQHSLEQLSHNFEVIEQVEITSIVAMLMKSQLRWAGHVSRMGDYSLPKMILYGELSTGHLDRGGPKKRYKNFLKKLLSTCHIDHSQWSTLAADRGTWRHIIHQAAFSFEDYCRINLKEKRCRRKNCDASTIVLDIIFICSRCGGTCLSRISLLSHERACSRRWNPSS